MYLIWLLSEIYELQDQPLLKRQSRFARKGNTLVVKYHDRSKVSVLTTYRADFVNYENKPLHIDEYNKYMGSVDYAGQMLELYTSNRKSLARLKKKQTRNAFHVSGSAEFLHYLQGCQ